MKCSRLNDQGHLVGTYEWDGSSPVPLNVLTVDPGDLPLNGTYKWDAERRGFIPLGFGLPRATRPPISDARVLYLTAKALGDGAPSEVRQWCEWYENNMQRREEESIVRRQRRGRR